MYFLAIADKTDNNLIESLEDIDHNARLRFCDNFDVSVFEGENEHEPYYHAMMAGWCIDDVCYIDWKN